MMYKKIISEKWLKHRAGIPEIILKKKCYGGYNKNPRQNITAKGIIFLSSATNIVFKASHGVYNVNIDCW